MKKLTPKQQNKLLIKRQQAECTLCDHRGYTFTIEGFERKAKPCKCTFTKKPQIKPILPYKDDMGDVILES
jgi:hypothetical protein